MKKLTSYIAAGIILSQTITISTASEQPNQPPVHVVTERASTTTDRAYRRYIGSVESINNVNIMPRVTGNLLKVCFTEGSMVKTGDLLYELENTTYLAAVNVLKAQISAQEATLQFAKSEYERKFKLLQSNVVAAAAHEQALMEINVAQANLKRLKASLLDAENTLSYTRIYSSINGIIGKSRFTVGNLITPQAGIMVDIQQISPIYVKFSISERALRRDFGGLKNLKSRALVQVKLADGTIYKETAKVVLIDNKVNLQSNTITMWALFQNIDRELLPGSFVTVHLSAITPDPKARITIMPSALVMENDSCYVFVINEKNNIPQKRKVTPGNTVNGRQIILEGIAEGDLIVVDGTHKIKGSVPVIPVPAQQVFKRK